MAKHEAEVVVVTGASAGVGRATAIAFAMHGARVALLARGQEGLAGAAEEVRSAGGTPLVLVCDVSDAAQIEAAAETVEKTFGPIDTWVNVAMVSVFSPVKEMTAEEFRRVTEVSYLGYVYGTQAALRRMLPRNRGVIVQVGSALAYRSIPLQAAYCGAKHAIIGFTDSLRSELIHDGSAVRVTVVQLPAVNTPQFRWVKSRLPNKPKPVPPIFQPEVPAQAIYWAAHHRRREVWVGFPTWEAIIGQRLVPGLLDWYLARDGYAAQQTDEPVEPDRRDNLLEPVVGEHGTHGDFDALAHPTSPQLWETTHRGTIALAVLGVAALVGTVAILADSDRRRAAAGTAGVLGALAGALAGGVLAQGKRVARQMPRLRVAFLRGAASRSGRR